MLSRRLDVQVRLINQGPPAPVLVGEATQRSANESAVDSPLTAREAAVEEDLGIERERERAIIKAALSIAEICAFNLLHDDGP